MKTLREFIHEQRNNRPINFTQDHVRSKGQCGCLLVHYAREVLGMKGVIECCFDAVKKPNGQWVQPPDVEFSSRAVHRGVTKLPKTYGQLKRVLRLNTSNVNT